MSQVRTRTGRRNGQAPPARRRAPRVRPTGRDLAEMLSVLSHDLRNPLTALVWNAPALRRILPPEHAGHRQIDMVTRCTDEIVQMLDDMSDASRILFDEPGLQLKLAPVDLAALVREVVAAGRPAAEARQLAISVSVEDGLAEVSCDRDRVVRVLLRLVAGAVRATPKGGPVTVRVEPCGGESGKACAEAGCACVRVSVEDGGPGVPEGDRATLFDLPAAPPPGQARRARTAGLGLSLFVARGVVEAHGGSIWVEGGPGGSRFVLELPVGGGDQPAIILAM